MRLFRPITLGLTGFALVVTLPASAALAAGGAFGWVGPGGKSYFVKNLPDKRCLDMRQEARGARNGTKQPLRIYAGKHCTGPATRLAPGASAPSGTRFASVVLNPR
ncbi:hypothetical protein GCM10010211_25740 [Streptomyces albospinus]|uniref:Uncharacterized protein n=2 Tax=Streptomyces albospinus TaxID=285515 RepID=A0ABQ2V040_9ACTN|nr:hypothetical protein GCM10010211_25740 [Streptomyces albospinus]